LPALKFIYISQKYLFALPPTFTLSQAQWPTSEGTIGWLTCLLSGLRIFYQVKPDVPPTDTHFECPEQTAPVHLPGMEIRFKKQNTASDPEKGN
jgi:hypothetical protein